MLLLSLENLNFKSLTNKSMTVDELFSGLDKLSTNEHKLYAQLSWELSDCIEIDKELTINKKLSHALDVINSCFNNCLAKNTFQKEEKAYVLSLLKKISTKAKELNNFKLSSTEILNIYILYSFAPLLIKPYWFQPNPNLKEYKIYNYVILNAFINSIRNLEISLGMSSDDTLKNQKYIKKLFFKLVDDFKKSGFLKITECRSGLKTQHFYSFDIHITRPFNPMDFGFYLYPLNYFKYNDQLYVQALTCTSINIASKPNDKSLKSFNLKNLKVLGKLFSRPLYFNKNMFMITKKIIFEFALGNRISIRELLEEEYFNYNKNKINELEINELYRFLSFLKLEDFLSFFENGFYFSYYFDFRGRLYYSGIASPQATHIFRFCYHYGSIKAEDLKKKSELFDVDYYANLIKKNTKFLYDYPNLTSEIFHYSVFWIFFEFGKINKAKLISVKKWWASCDDIINHAINIYNAGDSDSNDLEFKLQYNYLKQMLASFNKNLFYNFILYKDSTASGIQLLTLALQPKNQEVALACNLYPSQYYYDTYSYIINKFLSSVELSPISQIFFDRDCLKKSIMTDNYSVTFFSSFGYFRNNVYKRIKRDDIQVGQDDLKKLWIDFKKFHTFLNLFFEGGDFFKKSIKDIEAKLLDYLEEYKEIKITVSDGAVINLEYYKDIEYRVNSSSEGVRKTMKFVKPSDAVDLKQIKQSIKANLTHALEANLVRLVILDLKSPIITIHDCFGASICDVEELIESVNKNINLVCLNNDFLKWHADKEYYSIFIIM